MWPSWPIAANKLLQDLHENGFTAVLADPNLQQGTPVCPCDLDFTQYELGWLVDSTDYSADDPPNKIDENNVPSSIWEFAPRAASVEGDWTLVENGSSITVPQCGADLLLFNFES